MKKRLLNKNVFITGASSGIGRVSALEFAKEGANLFLFARNKERLESVKEEVLSLNTKCEIFLGDVTNKESIEEGIKECIKLYGSIDIFYSNAGIYLREYVKDMRIDQIRKIMEVDFFGNMNALYSILPYFLKRNEGTFITTCSVDGKIGLPGDAAYCSAKFALNGFFQVLRQELRGTNVHTTVIYPGRMDTPQIRHVDCPKISKKNNPVMVAKAAVKGAIKHKSEIIVPRFSSKLLINANNISNKLSDWLTRVNGLEGKDNGKDAINEAK
ncbi:MAG: SDR family NAD(P)-dependent oxidoreductase [Gammaproteobacteria bacterium]|nr:SDR family NAD(P)-dependent oxidoreductase [Gammaproteobacteria bacterium]